MTTGLQLNLTEQESLLTVTLEEPDTGLTVVIQQVAVVAGGSGGEFSEMVTDPLAYYILAKA